ncbi:MAG: hypothetical protein JWM80_5565 [Cyanobacteria bacterium RYN_339]|nr:hypothetical protein [Cyanobacteria bacterium RYN_339]
MSLTVATLCLPTASLLRQPSVVKSQDAPAITANLWHPFGQDEWNPGTSAPQPRCCGESSSQSGSIRVR